MILDKAVDEVKPTIVVVAYRRAKALNRLLNSLKSADYPFKVNLLISLEYDAGSDVLAVAVNFNCDKLNVTLLRNGMRLGLRQHILQCGDLALTAGSVIILEDDLVVDRYFYYYAVSALQFYWMEKDVAGISLYSYEKNEFAGVGFTPMANGYSTYMMQVPCSWGQCWTKHQWSDFKKWYDINRNIDFSEFNNNIPEQAKKWPKSSWKKYFFAYLIDQRKYFIYPYDSYSTNCSDPDGFHSTGGAILKQVRIGTYFRPIPFFNFVNVKNREVIYDAFMEPSGDFVLRCLGLSEGEVAIDLQGIKPFESLRQYRYALTNLPHMNQIKVYPLSFRPIELNLLYPGELDCFTGLYLINTNDLAKNKFSLRTPLELAYYSKMDLIRWFFLKSIIRALPGYFTDIVLKRLESFLKFIFTAK